MDNPILTQVIEQMSDLPINLQQKVLTFIIDLRQQEIDYQNSNAWDVLESLTGTVEAPPDWSTEHDHYLYGTPKRADEDS